MSKTFHGVKAEVESTFIFAATLIFKQTFYDKNPSKTKILQTILLKL